MSIGDAGSAMGGPAGVPDAASACKCIAVVGLFRQIPQFASGLHHFGQVVPFPDCQTRRIIAPVFQMGQPFQQNRRRLLAAGKTYNSTYAVPSSIFQGRVARSAAPTAAPRVLKKISLLSAWPRPSRYCAVSQQSDNAKAHSTTSKNPLILRFVSPAAVQPKGRNSARFSRFPAQSPAPDQKDRCQRISSS